MRIQLGTAWELGEPIDKGGFGEVFAAVSPRFPLAVAKLVPKAPGADRELLFADLQNVRNIMPIIDRGETATHWVLVMPRADKSLLQRMQEVDGSLELDEALDIVRDIVVALTDLEGRVVHRDLKPANVLLLKGIWVLSDFGISRYAESSTSADTRKFAMSPPYAAPERWRNERATTATDVYSLGVMAYELLTGSRPFTGPGMEDFREQHLHEQAPPVRHAPTNVTTLIEECLYKAPEARPTPRNLAARLEGVRHSAASPGFSNLEEVNRIEVSRRAEQERRASHLRSETERRAALVEVARRELAAIATTLKDVIIRAAPSVNVAARGDQYWSVELSQASLAFSAPASIAFPWQTSRGAGLHVVVCSSIGLTRPLDDYGYEGRSHSLWYCDAHEENHYQWFEMAFMFLPLRGRYSPRDPFALDPGPESAGALSAGISEVQVAWPFTPLAPGQLDEFVDRWAGWLAEAARGSLRHPSSMPERSVEGSWRAI